MRPIALLLAAFALAGCPGPGPDTADKITVEQAMGAGDASGFARALTPRTFAFPRDHAPHPEFKHEWWYFTGNLEDDSRRRFGYQVTFFRVALAPDGPSRPSKWATRQVWMVHVALSDVRANAHHAEERIVRDAAGLAGANAEPLGIWAEDWTLSREAGEPFWRLDVRAQGFSLRLRLDELRSPVLQGDAGLSQKSAEPGNASYYYSISRLATRGQLQLGDASFQVRGRSWLDREWSTSALGPNQTGWDWFSMQLGDGTDIMYYRLRRKGGGQDPHSRGSVLLPDGSRVDLRPGDVDLRPLAWWRGPDGGLYPVSWEIELRPIARTLRVRAMIEDQLMDLSVRYWEGAVEILDESGTAPIGYGYLEMTGY